MTVSNASRVAEIVNLVFFFCNICLKYMNKIKILLSKRFLYIYVTMLKNAHLIQSNTLFCRRVYRTIFKDENCIWMEWKSVLYLIYHLSNSKEAKAKGRLKTRTTIVIQYRTR